jgi:ferritin-like metal-binding protein YciE
MEIRPLRTAAENSPLEEYTSGNDALDELLVARSMPRDQKELLRFLSDMYSVEQQALAQLVSAPALVRDRGISNDLRRHYAETEEHLRLVRERLNSHKKSVSILKTAIMKAGGKGFLLFALTQPETPGKLVVHSYSYEAMEWAGYEILRRFAQLADDPQTVEVALTIRDQERSMMERLERDFDAAEEVSHCKVDREKMPNHLRNHLREAHALEIQSANFINQAKKSANSPFFTEVCNRHFEASRKHAKILEDRLTSLGAKPSRIADNALGFGGWNWNFFFKLHSDTPVKVAGFAYAHEHLKAAGYELLTRTANRAGDPESAEVSAALAAEQRAMADRVAGIFDPVVHTTLSRTAVVE